jgi:hypothetical protein
MKPAMPAGLVLLAAPAFFARLAWPARFALALLVVLPASTLAARTAAAWSRPALDLAVGESFGAAGLPQGGGLSATLSPLWPVGERARFGVALFADDIGTTLGHLYDPNDHTDLGLVAQRHRWTWGGAWRGDLDMVRRPRWTAAATGAWGYWRVEDDVRGVVQQAGSAVGFTVGAEARRTGAAHHQLGLVVRYHRLLGDRNTGFQRVSHYATGALEWRWAGNARD